MTENKTADIHMYINSPGGSVSARRWRIYDTMQFLDCPIYTYCMGLAASGAAILLAAGTKGKRFALPNSKVMIHQPYGQVGGQVSDIEIQANEILKEHERLNQILAKHTGQPIEIDRQRDRPRPLLHGRGGQGVRPGGRRARPSRRREEVIDVLRSLREGRGEDSFQCAEPSPSPSLTERSRNDCAGCAGS